MYILFIKYSNSFTKSRSNKVSQSVFGKTMPPRARRLETFGGPKLKKRLQRPRIKQYIIIYIGRMLRTTFRLSSLEQVTRRLVSDWQKILTQNETSNSARRCRRQVMYAHCAHECTRDDRNDFLPAVPVARKTPTTNWSRASSASTAVSRITTTR